MIAEPSLDEVLEHARNAGRFSVSTLGRGRIREKPALGAGIAGVKLACASGALDRSLERGDLTQLEFIDACAEAVACDGVVLDVRHFPRTDGDYVAQVKKMAVDRGLCIAALSDRAFFTDSQERALEVLERARALGAPLVSAPLAAQTRESWSEQLARINAATSAAKALNVTLAVRNEPGSFAATLHDCKRVSKEADSAWLRFGPQPQAFDESGDCAALAPNTVLLWTNVGEQTERAVDGLLAAFPRFRGFLVLDEPSGDASVADMQRAVLAWRTALCLNRT